MKTWLKMILALMGLMFLLSCSGATTGSAVEKTVILIVVLILLVLCALVGLGIGVWQFYRHNKDKIAKVGSTVDDVKQVVSGLKSKGLQ